VERRQLEYFVAVSSAGSLAAAAEELHISQPALSQAVKQLEKEVGCELFQRLPRGMRLTSAGEALLGPAKQLLRDFTTARASVDEVRGLQGGSLEIITLPGIVLDPLAEWISTFRKRAPKVQIRMRLTEVPEDIDKAIRSGDSELGLLLDPEVRGDLVVTRVGVQDIVAVFPPGSEPPEGGVTGKELLRYGMIDGGGGVGRELIRRESRRTGTECRPIIQVDRRDSALSLVLAGAGAAVFPRAVAERAKASGAVVRELHHPATRHIYALRRAGPPSPALRMFEGILPAVDQRP
jgi:DNA-binding transcriptional LysR family regulator